jgi:uncharacterized protein YfaT (DUF1175 family)
MALSAAVAIAAALALRLAVTPLRGMLPHAHSSSHFATAAKAEKESGPTKSFAAITGPWTDSFRDGTPDFLRLTDPADQAAFRQWFVAIAEFQAVRPRTELPKEITDCASLLRYAYREALKRHNDAWFLDSGMQVDALPGEIRAWRYPDTPLGAALFRVQPGSFEPADTTNGAFAQFADAKTLVEFNAYRVTRNVREAQPGDLLFYRQFGQSSPWHSMIVTRAGRDAAVVYDTGEDHGKAGELRRVSMAELLDHPQIAWRPVPSNPNFLGVYRWTILRGNL